MRYTLGGTLIYPVFIAGGLVLWVFSLAIVRMSGGVIETLGGSVLFLGGSIIMSCLIAVGVRSLSPQTRLVEAMAVFAVSALLADAILLKVFPFAYGPDERVVRHVMSWRVATGAFLLLAGILMEHRPITGERPAAHRRKK